MLLHEGGSQTPPGERLVYGCLRMGKMAVDEVERVLSGQYARYPVTEAMLKNMA